MDSSSSTGSGHDIVNGGSNVINFGENGENGGVNGHSTGAAATGAATDTAATDTAAAAATATDTPTSTPGRLKRQSAQLASLKNSLLYQKQPLSLLNSPVLKEVKGPNSDITVLMNTSRGIPGTTEFTEPELAAPTPSYSGLPLESGPNAKIKRESLWSTKLKKKPVKSASEPVDSQEPVDFQETEQKYNRALETGKSVGLTRNSKIRSVTHPKPKPQTKKHKISHQPSTPKTSKTTKPSTASPLRASKRIKVISPKKSITTANLAPSTTLANDNRSSPDTDEPSNDDFCSACGGSGVFICCETCPKSFHFLCCDPPLDGLPEDNWSCRECEAKKVKQKKPNNQVGIFGQLLNNLQDINPVEFQLPRKLRNNTFINVTTDDHGTYDDMTLKPELSFSKLNGNQIIGYNYNHDLEIDGLYDKNGNPYLCHKCGLSGLNKRIILHCDYCPLVWHIDCLKEPFYTPKTIGSKWRCPNHYEDLLPLNLYSKRNFKDTPIMDVSLHNHFLKIAQNGNVLIKYSDQPWLKTDGKLATLQEYLQYEQQNFNKFNPDYKDESMIGNNNMDNSDDIDEGFRVPDFFNNYPIKNAVVARPSPQLKKIITMTNHENNATTSFVYRVPEELIVLDFFSKVHKDQEKSVKQAIVNDLREYEEKIRDENEFVESVEQFQQNPVNNSANSVKPVNPVTSPSPFSIDDLVKAALGSKTKLQYPIQLSTNEVSELLSIKQLIQAKGKDEMLKFLRG